MRIFIHPSVEKFLKNLDSGSTAEIVSMIELLETYGHNLSMPHTKPIGDGLWELRITGTHASRILYGFHKDRIVLVVALKKQKMGLPHRDIARAKKRLNEYCKI